MACGNVVRPLSSGSRPRRPCRYSGRTNVRPMKLAMPNAMTMFVAAEQPVAEQAQRQHRVRRVVFYVSNQQGERDQAADELRPTTRGSLQQTRGSLVESVGDRRQTDARRGGTRPGRMARPRLGVLTEEPQPEEQGGDPERHVDVEDPAPTGGRGDRSHR